MSKNIMRTPEEKEKLVLEMINNGYGFHTMSKKHDISKSVLSKWYYSYKEKGIEGLKSNTNPAVTGSTLISSSSIVTFNVLTVPLQVIVNT